MLSVHAAESLTKGLEILGSGCFAYVFDMGGGKVLKRAIYESDGTRNWLEFCLYCREAGVANSMMPVVYGVYPVLAPDGTDFGYIAIMEKLKVQRGVRFYLQDDVVCTPDYHEIAALWYAYAQSHNCAHWDDFCNDCHSGNIMMRGAQYVITDPSTLEYRSMSATPRFKLES